MADDLCKNKKQRQRTVEEALAMGYEYSDGVFKFEGVACVPGDRLRELCFPDDIEDPEKRKLAVEEADRLFVSRAWFSAHWTFYDLPDQHLKLRTLRCMRYDLGELVKLGVCDELARRQAKMKKALEDEEKAKRDHRAIFSELSTPTLQATWDIRLFMEHYFMKNGKENKKVTRKPLVLHDVSETLYGQLRRVLATLPSLFMGGGKHLGKNFAVMGWSRLKVDPQIERLITPPGDNADDTPAVTKTQRRAWMWKTAMEEHHQYVCWATEVAEATRSAEEDRLTSGWKQKSKERGRLMHLDDAIGRYVIKSSDMVKQRGESLASPVFSIEIMDHPGRDGDDGLLVGKLDFEVLRGTMLLSFSKDLLNKTIKGKGLRQTDKEKTSSEIEYMDEYNIDLAAPDPNDPGAPKDAEERHQSSTPGTDGEPEPNSRKRKAVAMPRTSILASRAGSEPGKRPKPARLPKITPRRLYFMWSGQFNSNGFRFTSGGSEERRSSYGYLDFNDTCTEFKGFSTVNLGSFPLAKCKFQGFKTRGKGKVPKEMRGAKARRIKERDMTILRQYGGRDSHVEPPFPPPLRGAAAPLPPASPEAEENTNDDAFDIVIDSDGYPAIYL